jgi:hypothetical protein
VALVRTDVSEEPGASFTRVTKIGELETTQAATSNRRTLRRNLVFLRSVRRLLVAACVVPSSPIRVTLMKEAQVPPKRQFLQEPHGVTLQKTPFFRVTAVKTSNLTIKNSVKQYNFGRSIFSTCM